VQNKCYNWHVLHLCPDHPWPWFVELRNNSSSSRGVYRDPRRSPGHLRQQRDAASHNKGQFVVLPERCEWRPTNRGHIKRADRIDRRQRRDATTGVPVLPTMGMWQQRVSKLATAAAEAERTGGLLYWLCTLRCFPTLMLITIRPV